MMPPIHGQLLGFAAASLLWLPAGIVVLTLVRGFGLAAGRGQLAAACRHRPLRVAARDRLAGVAEGRMETDGLDCYSPFWARSA